MDNFKPHQNTKIEIDFDNTINQNTKIGIDFDNTIICYDKIFHQVALERGLIKNQIDNQIKIGNNTGNKIGNKTDNKNKIRDHLRTIGKEDEWTKMQGYVYGVRIIDAEPFEGIIDFLINCRQKQIPVKIISHRTKFPYLGEKYDLHKSAYNWLEKNGILNNGETGLAKADMGHIKTNIGLVNTDFAKIDTGLTKADIFFEETQDKKIKRIIECGCTHFIDDLPEFLMRKDFPDGVVPILFNGNIGESVKKTIFHFY